MTLLGTIIVPYQQFQNLMLLLAWSILSLPVCSVLRNNIYGFPPVKLEKKKAKFLEQLVFFFCVVFHFLNTLEVWITGDVLRSWRRVSRLVAGHRGRGV
ncbi:hypothetical protein RJT34_15729 [Clitoria ternatea]|uniref:Uncharacterized protein n=1 Tax=Clitoria ternatea TaxID=43366 RepID=A0AAN9J703_CLITE